MQLAALSCVLYVMQYIISIIHSYSGLDYVLQVLYWPRRIRAAAVLKIKKTPKKGDRESESVGSVKKEFDS